jgi:antiviral helicase SKI2
VGARGVALAQRGQQRGGLQARGGRGGGHQRTIHTASDKNLYVHLLGHLRKKGLLPVVVFTFSKKRCEENAATLTNADLSTALEKSEVHVAVEKALSRLKGLSLVTLLAGFLIGLHRFGQKATTNRPDA